MKVLSFVLLLALACSANAQGFFKPLAKPTHQWARFSDSAVAVAATPIIQNHFRPVASVTASISDGTQLAGGFGIGFQHNKFDAASQAWVTQYSISAIGFLGSNGVKATGTAGLVFGFLNFISIGPGYDFTTKKLVFLTGVQLHFN